MTNFRTQNSDFPLPRPPTKKRYLNRLLIRGAKDADKIMFILYPNSTALDGRPWIPMPAIHFQCPSSKLNPLGWKPPNPKARHSISSPLIHRPPAWIKSSWFEYLGIIFIPLCPNPSNLDTSRWILFCSNQYYPSLSKFVGLGYDSLNPVLTYRIIQIPSKYALFIAKRPFSRGEFGPKTTLFIISFCFIDFIQIQCGPWKCVWFCMTPLVFHGPYLNSMRSVMLGPFSIFFVWFSPWPSKFNEPRENAFNSCLFGLLSLVAIWIRCERSKCVWFSFRWITFYLCHPN